MTLPPKTRPILERLAYAIYVILLVASIAAAGVGALIGVETGHFQAVGAALIGLAIARWLHVHGHAHWHFREWDESFEVQGEPGTFPGLESDDAQTAGFAELFEQFEAEPDVWERGALRRKVAARLDAAPALRKEFADALAAHPEL